MLESSSRALPNRFRLNLEAARNNNLEEGQLHVVGDLSHPDTPIDSVDVHGLNGEIFLSSKTARLDTGGLRWKIELLLEDFGQKTLDVLLMVSSQGRQWSLSYRHLPVGGGFVAAGTVPEIYEPEFTDPAEPARKKVCIVTRSFPGFLRNAGMGTFCAFLAEILSSAGHDVTVLFVNSFSFGPLCEEGTPEHWIRRWLKKGITLVPFFLPYTRDRNGVLRRTSLEIYRWLAVRDFDCIHFHELTGLGYYSIMAARQGMAFRNTEICVEVHGPSAWARETGEALPAAPDEFEVDLMERKCVEYCDIALFPSRHIFDWVVSRGWKLPRIRYYTPLPYIPDGETRVEPDGERVGIREIVFFGRLETRKGLEIFCDAIDMADIGTLDNVSVTFLGRPGAVNNMPAEDYISSRARNWTVTPGILKSCSRAEALRYLKRAGVLAVVPSLGDNSPYSVIECLYEGVPVIATKRGGIPELFSARSPDCQVEANAESLGEALIDAVRNGAKRGVSARSIEKVNDLWLRFHREAFTRNSASQQEGLALNVIASPRSLAAYLSGKTASAGEVEECVIVEEDLQAEECIRRAAPRTGVRTVDAKGVPLDTVIPCPAHRRTYYVFFPSGMEIAAESLRMFRGCLEKFHCEIMLGLSSLSASGEVPASEVIPPPINLTTAVLTNTPTGCVPFAVSERVVERCGFPRSISPADIERFLVKCAREGFEGFVLPESVGTFRLDGSIEIEARLSTSAGRRLESLNDQAWWWEKNLYRAIAGETDHFRQESSARDFLPEMFARSSEPSHLAGEWQTFLNEAGLEKDKSSPLLVLKEREGSFDIPAFKTEGLESIASIDLLAPGNGSVAILSLPESGSEPLELDVAEYRQGRNRLFLRYRNREATRLLRVRLKGAPGRYFFRKVEIRGIEPCRKISGWA